ncbi:MAG: helix-turn-helix transcriptional regulator, partial [Oscillospiraceae bacterium]|nr:helix-turn-helix transcriptional regulator [Oscillospiraceae bacterium]
FFDTQKIKQRLKQLRKERGLTQEILENELHYSHSTISDWENEKKEIVPSPKTFVDLANYYAVDIDYLFGTSDVKSKDNQNIAGALRLSIESIEKLRGDGQLAALVDRLLTGQTLSAIAKRAQQISYHQILEDVMSTSFEKRFSADIQKAFDEYYFRVFPFEMSPESFKAHLKEIYPYRETFDANDFLEVKFLEDGRNFIYNSVEGFSSMSASEQHDAILSAIVDISYDYCVSSRVVELSKQKLVQMLGELLDQSIRQETDDIRARLKGHTAP